MKHLDTRRPAAFAETGVAFLLAITPFCLPVPAVAQLAELSPKKPPSQSELAQRTQEWTMLSSALEPKLARLLPCDAPVTASIDEVSQASEARFAAANKYWQSRSAALKSEIAAVEHTIALEQSRTADWTRDHADADQERTSVDAHVIALQRAVEKAPSLVDAEKQLRALAAATQQTAARSEARESAASSLIEGLRDVLRADQTQQNSVGAQLRSVAAEEAAYKEYYAARTARARTECTITGSSEPVVPASPRRTVPKRTSPIKPVAPPSASAN